MAFDHGAPKIIPINIALTCATVIFWSRVYPWWVIAPIGLIIAMFSVDMHFGMFIALLVMIPLAIMTPGITARLLELKGSDIPLSGPLFRELLKVGAVILLEFVVLTGIGLSMGKRFERETLIQ